MSPNRRILLNIVATYGRSLYGLALGLFTTRWALQALGQQDYGLFGLVGGMSMAVAFLNALLATSVSRFYAVSVGVSRKDGHQHEGLDECRRWFNTALSIHTILPLLLLLVGYPLGVWAVNNFLTIPAERVSDCICVWRCACVSCLINMMNVPFVAMYTAKQEIAEQTLFSLFSVTGNAVFLYWMVSHPRVWLADYAIGICLIGAIPQIGIALRACIKYPECKMIRGYWYDMGRYVQLAKFAVARFWAKFSAMFALQGYSILVNKFMGPVFNASMTVGNTIASQSATLSNSLSGAFEPAIGNLFGEGRLDAMKRMGLATCRMGAVLLLIFAVPVMLEVDELLTLWLVNPPEFANVLCIATLVSLIFDRMTDGYWMCIYAKGYKVVKYSWTIGWSGIAGILLAALLFIFGLGMWSIVAAWLVSRLITVAVRLWYGEEIIGFSCVNWLRKVFSPICVVAAVTFLVGCSVRLVFTPSLLRIIGTTAVCEIVMLPLAWYLVFEDDERKRLMSKVQGVLTFLRSLIRDNKSNSIENRSEA